MDDETGTGPHPRVLIAAFEGWSDAGAATTTVLQHLGELIDADVLHSIGADGFVDYQVHRPKISFDDDGRRVLDWPETRLYGRVERPGEPADPEEETIRRIDGSPVSDLFLLAGVEPARDWAAFADEVVDVIDAWEIDTVILLGSLYSDAPHSRPIIISLSSEDAAVRSSTGATRSDYEGPVGITTVLELALVELEVPVLTLWAQVPHYVHSAPSPKATLAMLDKLEELLDVVIPRGELLAAANEWEANIDRIAAADEDMARYIRALEDARDATSAPEATGDAIAYEFEKFLNVEPDEDDERE
ncbi:MAG: PAC2 family protein [Candidatus Leucobacter sulfamidivorax]|nr:PAC2 family protein [Candidatus Leucobacter sulfamidivorax]